jgi:hypothetical protein
MPGARATRCDVGGGLRMNVRAIVRRDRPLWSLLLIALRLLGVALTAAMGWIHLWLWLQGYREVPVIGTLFLVNAVCTVALIAALLAAPARFRRAVAMVAVLFTAGTLAGLVLSLTVGLFGTHESLQTPLVPTTLIVESAGVLVLGLIALLTSRPPADRP